MSVIIGIKRIVVSDETAITKISEINIKKVSEYTKSIDG